MDTPVDGLARHVHAGFAEFLASVEGFIDLRVQAQVARMRTEVREVKDAGSIGACADAVERLPDAAPVSREFLPCLAGGFAGQNPGCEEQACGMFLIWQQHIHLRKL